MSDVKQRPIKASADANDWVVVQGDSDGLGDEKRIKGGLIAKHPSFGGFPSASTFGVGIAQAEDTGAVYASDGAYWRPAGVKQRSTPINIATFGDSTADVVGGTSNTAIKVISASHPGSGATTLTHPRLDKMGVLLHYPGAKIVANGGIGGQTTTQMVARDNSAYSATRKATADVINENPDIIFLRAGINDLTGVTSGTWSSVADTTIANIKTLIHRLLAGGSWLVVECMYGYSGTPTDLASTRLALLKVNSTIKAYVESIKGKAVFVDFTGITMDSTGAYLSGISTDGTHLNSYGGYIAGKAEKEVLLAIFGDSVDLKYPGTNLISNQVFSDVSSGQPVGFNVYTSNCSVSNKQVVNIDNSVYFQFDVTPSAINSTVEIRPPFNPTAALWNGYSIAANDQFGAEVDFIVEPISGDSVSVNVIRARFDLFKSGAGRVLHEVYLADVTVTDETIEGKCQTLPMQWVEAAAAYTTSSLYNLYIGSPSTAAYRVKVTPFRLVKLN